VFNHAPTFDARTYRRRIGVDAVDRHDMRKSLGSIRENGDRRAADVT
jgi:hypothetical protein